MATRRFHTPKIASSILALATALALAACAQQPVRSVPVAVPLPAHPAIPTVQASELQCLSDSTYTKIVNRERGYKGWGLQLEAIIQSYNANASEQK